MTHQATGQERYTLLLHLQEVLNAPDAPRKTRTCYHCRRVYLTSDEATACEITHEGQH